MKKEEVMGKKWTGEREQFSEGEKQERNRRRRREKKKENRKRQQIGG